MSGQLSRPSASIMASCTAGRTWRICSLARVGFTRLVSSTTNRCAFRIDPQRSSGETRVSEAGRREIVASRRVGGVGTSHPKVRAESPIVCRCGELLYRGARQQAMVRVNAAIQQHLRKCRHVSRGGKQPGVPGNSTHGPRVLIMYLAAQQPLAEVGIIFSGRDPGTQRNAADCKANPSFRATRRCALWRILRASRR